MGYSVNLKTDMFHLQNLGIPMLECLLGGTAPPTPKAPKLAYFVLYLKIINICLKINIRIL